MVLALVQNAMEPFFPATETLPGLKDTGIRPFLERLRRETTLTLWLGVLLGTLIAGAGLAARTR